MLCYALLGPLIKTHRIAIYQAFYPTTALKVMAAEFEQLELGDHNPADQVPEKHGRGHKFRKNLKRQKKDFRAYFGA